jgi:hypothetical protein
MNTLSQENFSKLINELHGANRNVNSMILKLLQVAQDAINIPHKLTKQELEDLLIASWRRLELGEKNIKRMLVLIGVDPDDYPEPIERKNYKDGL